MDDVLKWFMEHWGVMLVVLYALLNVTNGILSMIDGDQGEGPGGWISKVRSVLDRISVLTGKGDPSSLKVPGTASKLPSDEV